MQINRQELLTALEKVKPGLANKEMIEQSTSFAFMDEKIVTYNDEISISHPVKNLNITGAVKAEELYKLLGKLKKDEIEVEITDNEILLTSGKAKAGLTLQQEITLPLDEIEIGAWKKLPDPEEFKKALSFVLFSVSKDMSRPVLTCIHIDEAGYVEACDNQRLARYQIKKLPINIPLIPAFSINELLKYDFTHVCLSKVKGWAHFKTKEGTIFSCRTLAESYGDFPDVSHLLEIEGKEITFPKTINEILDRAIIFAKQDFAMDENITINIKNKKIQIRAEGPSGWFEEQANIRYSNAPISFAINPNFFKDIINQSSSCIVGEKCLKFIGGNWEHVVMVRVN
jgi:DNA polymerase III sliding clamp (beta) subunit (PCNA family)